MSSHKVEAGVRIGQVFDHVGTQNQVENDPDFGAVAFKVRSEEFCAGQKFRSMAGSVGLIDKMDIYSGRHQLPELERGAATYVKERGSFSGRYHASRHFIYVILVSGCTFQSFGVPIAWVS